VGPLATIAQEESSNAAACGSDLLNQLSALGHPKGREKLGVANTSIGFGTALMILLGAGGFFATGAEHPTALMPAAAGILLIVLGLLARNPKLRMHAMHGAALIGLLRLSDSAIVAQLRIRTLQTFLRAFASRRKVQRKPESWASLG